MDHGWPRGFIIIIIYSNVTMVPLMAYFTLALVWHLCFFCLFSATLRMHLLSQLYLFWGSCKLIFSPSLHDTCQNLCF